MSGRGFHADGGACRCEASLFVNWTWSMCGEGLSIRAIGTSVNFPNNLHHDVSIEGSQLLPRLAKGSLLPKFRLVGLDTSFLCSYLNIIGAAQGTVSGTLSSRRGNKCIR